jgi:hypothetical protein
MAKKTKVETPKMEVQTQTPAVEKPKDVNRDLEYAKHKLAVFSERRINAKTPDELEKATFWEKHFRNLVAELSK